MFEIPTWEPDELAIYLFVITYQLYHRHHRHQLEEAYLVGVAKRAGCV